ncbi:hypothetical protein [Nocardia sp. alder85J]|uniref:hypothetical protein n=1 Tax=Nocardia sp. alder85J TaxID=2862949 RepID=UPI001CD5016D|nr:hypothetical protein [Nocardia sp. alder85J]MCX4097723.1 hypothetical protein [Nocardia sp. alder85J]
MSKIEDRGRIVKVLYGHTDAETAHIDTDYPWGYRLRCTRRSWVETAVRGVKRGQSRLVTQTTDPRRSEEFWNAPKPGRYARKVFLTAFENGQVDGWSISDYGIGSEEWTRVVVRGLWEHLDQPDRDFIVSMVAREHRTSTAGWSRWHTDVTDIRAAGAPEFTTWTAAHPDWLHRQEHYDLLRDYVMVGGPDVTAEKWWIAH